MGEESCGKRSSEANKHINTIGYISLIDIYLRDCYKWKSNNARGWDHDVCKVLMGNAKIREVPPAG